MDKSTEIIEAIKNHEYIAIKPITKTKDEIALELLSCLSEIDIESLSKGNLKKYDWGKLTESAVKLSTLNLYFIEGDETKDSRYKVIRY